MLKEIDSQVHRAFQRGGCRWLQHLLRENKDLEIVRRPLMTVHMWLQQGNGGGITRLWRGAEECSKSLEYIFVVNER